MLHRMPIAVKSEFYGVYLSQIDYLNRAANNEHLLDWYRFMSNIAF